MVKKEYAECDTGRSIVIKTDAAILIRIPFFFKRNEIYCDSHVFFFSVLFDGKSAFATGSRRLVRIRASEVNIRYKFSLCRNAVCTRLDLHCLVMFSHEFIMDKFGSFTNIHQCCLTRTRQVTLRGLDKIGRYQTTTEHNKHYDDVIMDAMASEITSLTIVYSTVYSGTDQSKHQSSALLAFVWGIHRWPVNSPHKGPVTRKMLPFDDVIMNSERLQISWGIPSITNVGVVWGLF